MSDLPAADVTVGAVILGAGFSRRFGDDKRIQPLHESTVAEVTVSLYLEAFTQVRVVLRDDDYELAEKLTAAGAQVTTCSDAHLGMGHSLAAGFQGLNWQWAFVGLLDMPFVRIETLNQLIRIARDQSTPGIIRPRMAGRDAATSGPDNTPFGHPIGWHADYFDEIRKCTGDAGARQLLRKHVDDVVEVELDDPGILQDIDTRADLESAQSSTL